MNKGKVLASLFIIVSISLIGCASAPSLESVKQQKTVESLSESAYNRVLPRLVALRPGDNIESIVEWHLFKLKYHGQITTVAVADGWVAPLSGGDNGAAFGLGRVRGRAGDTLFGEHVFGYLWGGTTLIPQYAVVTQATLILPDEYHELMEKSVHRIGWADKPRDDLFPKTQFKDVTVKEVRRLNFPEPKTLEVAKVEKVTFGDIIRENTTRERFEVAVKRLKSLAPGTDYWEAIRALDGIYMTPDSGIKYHILADGFLGGSWVKLIPNGFFVVMRFGYIENNKEVPKLALIFKNNKVHKLVPHASREALQRYFKE